MIYTNEENLTDLLKALRTFGQEICDFVDSLQQESWVESQRACEAAGVENRRLRYLADTGRIHFLFGENKRRLYSLSDCVNYRNEHSEEILSMKGGRGSA